MATHKKQKRQIFLIHGGMTFKNRKDYLKFLKTRPISLETHPTWSKEYLDQKLGKTHSIIRPRMPLQDNARYEDWKIYFERFIPHMTNGVVLIGNSLGGIFLAKYLSEHTLPKKIGAVFLVCPPFDGSLTEEDLVGGFILKSSLTKLETHTKNLHLMFSEDDMIVPVSHAEKYRKKLPKANIHIYKGKNGHFFVPTFPEIVSLIRAL